jgi:hypothetical protein
MLVYALVDAGCRDAVDLYLRREDAERDLADALADVPLWCDRLEVVELDFGATSPN